MKTLTRLVDRLLFGPPSPPRPRMPARPSNQKLLKKPLKKKPSQAVPPFVARTQEPPIPLPRFFCPSLREHDLLTLVPWLMETEKARYLERIQVRLDRHDFWTIDDVPLDYMEQLMRWTRPLLIHSPETVRIEDFCLLLEGELLAGLMTYRTPDFILPRPTRMIWLSHHGRRAEYVFRVFEEALGSRAEAMQYFWAIIAGL